MAANDPLLTVRGMRKEYNRGFFLPASTFSLEADFSFTKPAIVGVMGGNGAGKTTLFEIITGTTPPTRGEILCKGQNIQNVKVHQRSRLAIHYHQSYQVRRIKWTRPDLLLERAGSDYPLIHLFDEPQFNTSDGYIPFMVNFFRKLRSEGRLVFISLHPNEAYQLEILHELCECFIFVHLGHTKVYPRWKEFVAEPHIRTYLSHALTDYEALQRARLPQVYE